MKTWFLDKLIRWKIWRYECSVFYFRKMLSLVQMDLADMAKEARRLNLEDASSLIATATVLIQCAAKIILKHKKDLQ